MSAEMTKEQMDQIEQELFPNQFSLGEGWPGRGRVVLRISQRGSDGEWTNFRPNKRIPRLKEKADYGWESFKDWERRLGKIDITYVEDRGGYIADGGGFALLQYLEATNELNVLYGTARIIGDENLNKIMNTHIKKYQTLDDMANREREEMAASKTA